MDGCCRLLRSAADSSQDEDSTATALQRLLSGLAQNSRTQPLTSAFFLANISNAQGAVSDKLLLGTLTVLAPHLRLAIFLQYINILSGFCGTSSCMTVLSWSSQVDWFEQNGLPRHGVMVNLDAQ